jgi:RimK-like ATP-grasp domain
VSTTPQQEEATRRVVHVSRHPTGESLKSARAIKRLDGVCLLGICEGAPRADGTEVFDDLVFVTDAHNADQLITAARMLGEKHGTLSQLVTAQETLLEAVAQANEALALNGMSVATVRRALDKSSLKQVLEQAGISTARDRLITDSGDARRFVDEVGFPIVLKPLTGSGGLATWCIRSNEQLELALTLMQPSLEKAVLAEDYLQGQELCIDTITIANEPRFHSVCCYRPSILEALENPQVQWTCVMPRDITGDEYSNFIRQGLVAVRALAVGNAMTHMEGFLLADGGLSFTDATLRPAGARIAPMLAFAYDIDPYMAWARVAVDGCFDGPWQRKYAVGTIFLRGLGDGLVEHVEGLEAVRQQVGELVADARLPRVGATKSATYTGDGYITIRHPETRVVEDALQLIAHAVRITYSHSELPGHSREAKEEQWSQQLGYFDKQLNRPVWDDDSLLIADFGLRSAD